MIEIDKMVQNDIKHELDMLDEAKAKMEERKAELRKEQGLGPHDMYRVPTGDKLYEIREKYNYYLKLNAMYGYVGARARIEKDVKAHYEKLQQKVEKKIGKILEIEHLGGLDYRFKGEEGSCMVEVIWAGGYNVQRAHTRWIIRK